MGLSEAKLGGPRDSSRPAVVVWHDLECGAYEADLALWRALAQEACPPARDWSLLDVGAGTGRVTLELARHGHRVDALDRDPELLAALRGRASSLPVRTFCADARDFELERRDYALCIVPMQTIQLLADTHERCSFLARAHAHLRPGAPLACAIVTEIEPFDCALGDLGPPAESGRVGTRSYATRAVRVAAGSDGIVIERERSIRPARPGGRGRHALERDVIRLAPVSASELQREGEAAGFTPRASRHIGETADHAGSQVVVLRA